MGEVGRLYGTRTVCSLDTPFMSFLIGLLVNTLGLVNEKWLVKIWQTGQLIWCVWWPGLNATLEHVCF